MVVLETLQQIYEAASVIAPPNSNPLFFWGTLLLAFAILFVAMGRIPFFQESKWKPAQFIIALIMAYFAAASAFTTVLLAKLFPNFAIVVTAILVFMILGGMLGFEIKGRWVGLVIGIALYWLFVTTTSQYVDFGTTVNVFEGWELIDWILVGGILLALVYFIPGAKETVKKIVKIE